MLQACSFPSLHASRVHVLCYATRTMLDSRFGRAYKASAA